MLILVTKGMKVKAINLDGPWVLEINEPGEGGTVKLELRSSFGRTVILDGAPYHSIQRALEKARRVYMRITDAFQKGDALLEIDLNVI